MTEAVTEVVRKIGLTYAVVHDPEEFGFTEISREMTDSRRWAVVNELTLRRDEDETFWRLWYDEPATENQEWSDPSTEVYAVQVWPAEKTVTVYVSKKPEAVPA